MTSFLLGRRLGPRVPRAPRREGAITEERLHRSRASSTGTAARRSSSGASSASCARSRRSSPARRGCPAALPALRRHRRRPVGVDLHPARLRLLGRASTASSTTPSRARWRWARSSSSSSGSSGVRWMREPENRRRAAAWLEEQAERPARCGRLAAVAPAGRSPSSAARPLVRVGPPDAGRARARGHDAAGRRSASPPFVFTANASTPTEPASDLDADGLRLADRLTRDRRRRREGRHRPRVAAGDGVAGGRSRSSSCSGGASRGALLLVIGRSS